MHPTMRREELSTDDDVLYPRRMAQTPGMSRSGLPAFNDIFSLLLVVGGAVGALVSMQWNQSGGIALFSFLVGFGLGIYSDKAR